MENKREEILSEIYNLILNPATRKWERSILIATRDALENKKNLNQQIEKLEFSFRPLALRNNLTPDVADFYAKITSGQASTVLFDISKHSVKDLPYQERAVFAGGCFWCMVEPFENKEGIISVLSGYTGGHTEEPTYEQVLGGYTGHVEAVEIIFDTRVVNYADLIELYWQLTDPTDEFGQIADRGSNYRPVIFVKDEQQRMIAEKSKRRLAESGKYKRPIVTSIETASTFWPAENYHQQFYKKNRKRYKRIKRTRQQYLVFQNFQGKVRLGIKKFMNKF
ncbi:peptide-methionine (S)-S-oxide reductase MsrA [Liquorilactobacillus uvarum]|uniref:Peptide methionine sulfoxide reductase MsrA n=1 Tax=Liquorilactobacillus uvarum DSM 19971 TaxID=1423812 RepID=A0A0R1PX93_9LACO|nr:peptide-methionine (S)-S-oxide reductase MsrA [Liquorilactobacillus uvarum]KRL37213.1 peptide methionine sulfoxide reductase [Liquorilactobacillus uvarum DSM 19971]